MIHFMTHVRLGNSEFSPPSESHSDYIQILLNINILSTFFGGCQHEKQLPWTDRESDKKNRTEQFVAGIRDQSQQEKEKSVFEKILKLQLCMATASPASFLFKLDWTIGTFLHEPFGN